MDCFFGQIFKHFCWESDIWSWWRERLKTCCMQNATMHYGPWTKGTFSSLTFAESSSSSFFTFPSWDILNNTRLTSSSLSVNTNCRWYCIRIVPPNPRGDDNTKKYCLMPEALLMLIFFFRLTKKVSSQQQHQQQQQQQWSVFITFLLYYLSIVYTP